MTDERLTSADGAELRVFKEREAPRALVLVLHGGRERGLSPTRWSHLALARMLPFAFDLDEELGPRGVEVWRLRFAVRGWNGEQRHPLRDARWALDRLHERAPGAPIVLVGHSMGGRTAVAAADHPAVTGVVALAPWLPPGEPTAPVEGKRVVVLHGSRDRWVPAKSSEPWATAAGADRRVIRGTGHAMVRRFSTWHRLTTEAVSDILDRRTRREP